MTIEADIYEDTWSSIVVWVRGIITYLNQLNPTLPFEFLDWEAAADIQELGEKNYFGPSAVVLREYDAGLFEFSVAIAVSTYSNDTSLFRLRQGVNGAMRAMMSGRQIPYYDRSSFQQESVLQFGAGTEIAPMTRPQGRPYQFVQGGGLLVPLVDP